MTSGETSKKKKTTGAGGSKTRRTAKRPLRKPVKKSSAVSKAARPETSSRFFSPPLLTIWVLAVIALAGLIYLGMSPLSVSTPPTGGNAPPSPPGKEHGPQAPPAGRGSAVSRTQPEAPAASNQPSGKGVGDGRSKEASRVASPTEVSAVSPMQHEAPAAPKQPSGKGVGDGGSKEASRVASPPEASAVSPTQHEVPAAPKQPSGKGILGPPPKIVSRDIPVPEVSAVSPAQPAAPAAPNHAPEKLASLGQPPAPRPPEIPPAAPTASMARVAIVIDDFGPNLETAKRFMAIPLPLTFAVLPNQHYTREIADLAHFHHREVILHLPMEPHGRPGVNPGEGALALSMSPDDILKNVRRALDSTPHVSGANNHMGSRFTEDAESMKIVLGEFNRRGLYFIDSGTSPASCAQGVARQLSVPFGRRDIFLDHNKAESAVRLQLSRLIRKARVEGSALAIGHPYDSTFRALHWGLRQFQQERVAVVPARELVSNGLPTARK